MTIAKPDLKKDIDDAMSQAIGQGWQLAIIVLNNTRPEVYEYVKQCGNQQIGLITQCVNFQSLERLLKQGPSGLRRCKRPFFSFHYHDIKNFV